MTKEIALRIDRQVDIVPRLTQAEVLIGKGIQAGPVEVIVRRPNDKRTLDQNKKLWPMLSDVARQCTLIVDGESVKAPAEDWKEVFTNALRKHQRVAKGLDGGLVFLGARTSRMKKAEFAELIELIYAYGAEQNIRWSEPALKAYQDYREVAA
ncbi:recombination protein NinB [Phytohalomonas tamaricis]|uniref:recombination protein NinB n=1 Tax=Phytohalomonas tamaricis TaxID=2081032 RepID=UPI000D0ABD8D|nr:recombination protein NinB [Phytohalomonas tamaricis]